MIPELLYNSNDDTKTDIADEIMQVYDEIYKQKQIINEAQSKIEGCLYNLRNYLTDIKVAELEKIRNE